MQRILEKRNDHKVHDLRKRNHRYTYSCEVSEKRHLRDSYLKELKEESEKERIHKKDSTILELLKKGGQLKKETVEKIDDYEFNLNKNRINCKGIYSTENQMVINRTPEIENANQDNLQVYEIKDIRSRLTREENKFIKGKLHKIINSSNKK